MIIYPKSNLLEVWDWVPPSHAKVTTKCSGDTLYLQGQYTLSIPPSGPPDYGFKYTTSTSLSEESKVDASRTIETVKILNGTVEEGHTILVLSKTPNSPLPYALEVHLLGKSKESSIQQILEFPCVMQESESELEFIIKANDKFIVVSNNEGFLYLFKFDGEEYRPANYDLNLLSIRKNSCQPIISQDRLSSKITDEEILLKTSCFDRKPIFDIVGNWLVYSPTKFEYDHLKVINNTNDKIVNVFENEDMDPISSFIDKGSNRKQGSIFTPVRLPPPGPLLNRVISTLSNNALDGLFKLSEVGSTRLKAYLNKDKEKVVAKNEQDMAQSLNSISKTIGKALYSTASSTVTTILKKTMALQPNNNQLIKIIDLSNDKIIGVFKPPGGVSNLSLSPFDLQLVHSSYRGDNFFMWDLYKLPNEISLIGKFNRGKTSAIIKEIFWFVSNYDSTNIIRGNNLGFGCITKATGSVHWFNINYLSGDLTNNYPNNLNKDNLEDVPPKGQFLDSWVLSSINATKFTSLPNIANNINSKYKSDSKFNINQLAILDNNDQIKLISPLNGNHLFKYELPKREVNEETIFENNLNAIDKTFFDITSPEVDSITPLSQAEIETCGPYLNLVNNKNIQFSTYNFDDDSQPDYENFLKEYIEFGNYIPVTDIKFNNQRQKSPIEPLLSDFSEGLVMDQENLDSSMKDTSQESLD